MQLTKEQQLTLLTARVTFVENEIDAMDKIVHSKDFNWFEFAKLCMYHKTLTLAHYNLRKYLKFSLPKYLGDVFSSCHYCIEQRNILQLKEVARLQEHFSKQSVIVIPVKGSFLLQTVYQPYGVRYCGDMDFLFCYDDKEALHKVLMDCGYVIGRYLKKEGKIIEPTRSERIKWSRYMTSLHPYSKLSEEKLFPAYTLDFRHSLDDNLDKKPVKEIVDSYKTTGNIMPCHILAHLCAHFYDESKHTVSIYGAKDFNLIKLCDIREYYLCYASEQDLIETFIFMKKYGLQHKVFFTMYYLDLIYHDGYEKIILDMDEMNSQHIINAFGESTNRLDATFCKDIWQRLFSCGNQDELKNVPSALS